MGSAVKRQAREERRTKANARALTVVDPRTVRDPLVRARRPRRVWMAATLGCVVVSLLLHGAVVLAASLLPAAPAHVRVAPIRVQILAAPEPAAAPKEVIAAPTVPPPPREVRRPLEPSREIAKAPPPPDPTSEPPPPPVTDPPPSPTPRRRVVGIGLESTTTAGAGAAFAAGNTRMGATDGVAADPSTLGGRPARAFTPPHRKSEAAPRYPAILRERGVEGEVGVEVEIDATGRVSRVAVVRSSPHPEFDRAAADAATLSTYEPATLDGRPVANVITFTVRFRLHP